LKSTKATTSRPGSLTRSRFELLTSNNNIGYARLPVLAKLKTSPAESALTSPRQSALCHPANSAADAPTAQNLDRIA
jgi:hypothetical protein